MECFVSPSSYLDRHLEPFFKDEQEATQNAASYIGSVDRPLGEVQYQNSGEVELRADDVTIYYEYREASSAPEKRTSSKPFGTPDEWRDIVNFTILNEKSGESKTLADLYPYEYRTTFRATDDQWIHSYHYDDGQERMVVMACRLLTPRHIAGLGHEIGHAVGRRTHPYLYDSLAKGILENMPDSNEAQSILLMKERSAWAYCMNFMRPMVSNDPSSPLYYKAVHEMIHRESLKTYSDNIRELRSTSVSSMGNLAVRAS